MRAGIIISFNDKIEVKIEVGVLVGVSSWGLSREVSKLKVNKICN
jgi:hypothetical protein